MIHRMLTLAVVAWMTAFGVATAGCDGASSCDGNSGCRGVCVNGFVDASYSGNVDRGTDTFGLDQAEVDVTRCFGGRGALRADLEWVKDGEEWVLGAEQGFLDYAPAFAPRVTFTLGKFNAPIGFELLDPNEMYQFSHALVFDYGIPTNLTGAMIASEVAEGFDLRAYLVNGWDKNDLGRAGPKTAGGRAGYSPCDFGALGVSVIAGSEEIPGDTTGTTFDRTVVDVDLTLRPVAGLVIGGEFNYGAVDVTGTDATWTGFLAMAHYDFNEWLGLTGRFDWFDDPDDWVFGSGLMETRTAITIAPTFVLGDGMGALVEVRVDGSSEDVFVDSDGDPSGSTTSVAFEMTYSF